ncbi:MAG: hypothetical protein AB8G96_10400 [Phycisphaerales bacterium]
MQHRRIWTGAFSLLAFIGTGASGEVGGGPIDRGVAGVAGVVPSVAIAADVPGVTLNWEAQPDGRWAGPSIRPNRLLDWRIRAGRLECVRGGPRVPVRTAHVLTGRVGPWGVAAAGAEIASFRVRVGLPQSEASPSNASQSGRTVSGDAMLAAQQDFRGLLLGVGQGGDDAPADTWRRSLTQHRPGSGGGMLVVVDDAGQPLLRDFERAVGGGGGWTLNGPLAGSSATGDAEAAAIVGQRRAPSAVEDAGAAAATHGLDAVWLRVVVRASVAADRVSVVVETSDGDGAIIGRTVHDELESERVLGGVAFVSHHGSGPRGANEDQLVDWFDDFHGAGSGWTDVGRVQFGPVVSVQYLVVGDTIRLTAQGVPFDDGQPRPATLERRIDGAWKAIATAPHDPIACTWRFIADGPAATELRAAGGDIRVVLREPIVASGDASGDASINTSGDAERVDAVASSVSNAPRDPRIAWAGRIRPEPPSDRPVVVASLNCQKSWTGVRDWTNAGVWYPHEDTVAGVLAHDPDLVVFTGDQLYEGDVTGAIRASPERARLDYLDKWLRFCVSFGPLTRDRPTLSIPDDHDVYHGNIWGAGGRAAIADRANGTTAQDAGGYVMSAAFVNMVHRTQVSHLPPSAIPEPIGIGIVPWTTRFQWGGVDFAVVADRMFKAAPRPELPEFDVRNGWIQAPGIRAVDADRPRAPLLGAEQERFLADWAVDFSNDRWAKVVLSATPLAAVATLPPGGRSGSDSVRAMIPAPGERIEGWSLAADFDTNGWPMSGRRRALEAIWPGAAIHLCGDQHLASLVQYGIERHGDAGYAFCSPAIANTWPRRWYPPGPAAAVWPGAPWWAGDRRDGFGNLMTVHAVANPQRSGRSPSALHDRMPGYGIVRLERSTRRITFEAWPRSAEPEAVYPHWPRTVGVLDNMHGDSAWALAPIIVESVDEPVVVVRDGEGQIVAAGRVIAGQRMPVPGRGPWTLELGEPGTDRWRRLEQILADPRRPVHRSLAGVDAAGRGAGGGLGPDAEPEGSTSKLEAIIVRWE